MLYMVPLLVTYCSTLSNQVYLLGMSGLQWSKALVLPTLPDCLVHYGCLSIYNVHAACKVKSRDIAEFTGHSGG